MRYCINFCHSSLKKLYCGTVVCGNWHWSIVLCIYRRLKVEAESQVSSTEVCNSCVETWKFITQEYQACFGISHQCYCFTFLILLFLFCYFQRQLLRHLFMFPSKRRVQIHSQRQSSVFSKIALVTSSCIKSTFTHPRKIRNLSECCSST